MKKVFGWLLVLAVLCMMATLPALAETITVADAGACFGATGERLSGWLHNNLYEVNGSYSVFSVSDVGAIDRFIEDMKSLGWSVSGSSAENYAFFCWHDDPLVGLIYYPESNELRVYYDSDATYTVSSVAQAPVGHKCFICGGTGVCVSCDGDGEWITGQPGCFECGGNGVCPWCHGDGTVSDNENYKDVPEGVCAICEGSGVCQICWGAGRISGIATYGQGGSDYVDCSGCDGNGICEYCDGTGRDD